MEQKIIVLSSEHCDVKKIMEFSVFDPEAKQKKHDILTKFGLPKYSDNYTPLARYCHYLHDCFGLEYQLPNAEIVNDFLFNRCGSKLIFALA